MPEAVIVATARSPIGRASKGSLAEARPDDLAATVIRAALAKVPQMDPTEIDDLLLGCGLPGGEQGNNLARVVAVLLGYDHLPATTVTRYCSSSLQTTRMAMHAIRAGEGDIFVSAGVEMVSRYVKGNSDTLPDTHNPRFDAAAERTRRAAGQAAGQGADDWHDPREDGELPDVYIAMGQTAENVARLCDISREEMDHYGVRSQNLAEKAIANGFWAREITPVTTPSGSVVSADDGPWPGVTYEGVRAFKPENFRAVHVPISRCCEGARVTKRCRRLCFGGPVDLVAKYRPSWRLRNTSRDDPIIHPRGGPVKSRSRSPRELRRRPRVAEGV